MKLSELEYGERFRFAQGEQEYIKSNRIEGGLRLCMNLKGEMLDFNEDNEIEPTKKENKE